MPTVPSPNSSAFGGGGLPQAQHNLGTAVIGFGNQIGKITRDLADRENKAKYREDAQTRISRLQEAQPLLAQTYRNWLANEPSTRGDKDTLKAELDSKMNDLLAPKEYHFQQSKLVFANELGEISTKYLMEAGKAVNNNGIMKAKRATEQFVGQMAEHLRRSPSAFPAKLVELQKAYEREGVALGEDSGEYFRSKVVQLATVAQQAFIELGDVKAAEAITRIPEVSNALKVEERAKLWATADKAKVLASKDARQAQLDNALIGMRNQQTALAGFKLRVAKFKFAGVTGSRKPTKVEADAAEKAGLEIEKLEKGIEKTGLDIERLQNKDDFETAKAAEVHRRKITPKTQQLLASHRENLNTGVHTQEMARTLLNAAVEYMTAQRPRPGTIPAPPPGYATALQDMGINVNSYVTGSAVAVQDAEEAIGKLPSTAGDAERIATNLSTTSDPASVGKIPSALASASEDPSAVIDREQGIGDQRAAAFLAGEGQASPEPSPASGAETAEAQEHQKTTQAIPELSATSEPAFEKANTVEGDDTGQAITALKSISDTGMTVHNLIDLTHGVTNTVLRNMYEFSPTAPFVPDQKDKTLAAQRLRGATRLLIFATERQGRFTDDYRKWLLNQFSSIEPGMFKNPEAAKTAVEGIASVLVEQAVLHAETAEKAKAGGDPNLGPLAGQEATKRIKEIKQMIRVLGAPIPMTNYTADELSSEQVEAASERVRNFVKAGILEPGDKISIGGRVATVSGGE